MRSVLSQKNIATFAVSILLFSIVGFLYHFEIPAAFGMKAEQKQEISTIKVYEPKRIVADLQSMKIRTYENGEMLREIHIVSKGRPESYYETPVGDYEIILKEKSHFSSIGKVYMPYSMQFFGNFFVHGIPYYPNGEKVSSTYSGGCIRLADEDAVYLYEFADKGTTLTVTNTNNEISYEEMSDAKFVKLMNALVALENVSMTDANLATVKEMIRYDYEANASYLGRQIGTSFFLDQMNKKAKAIGLTQTTFIDIKREISTTKEDKDAFVRYIYNNKFYLYNIAFRTQS